MKARSVLSEKEVLQMETLVVWRCSTAVIRPFTSLSKLMESKQPLQRPLKMNGGMNRSHSHFMPAGCRIATPAVAPLLNNRISNPTLLQDTNAHGAANEPSN